MPDVRAITMGAYDLWLVTLSIFAVLVFVLLTRLADRKLAARVAEADALRQSEERLRALGERLSHQLDVTRAITHSLGEGVYALDRHGLVTFVNPAAEAMLGWTEAELLGRDMHDAIHFQDIHGTRTHTAECPLLDVLRSGTAACSDDDLFTRKDGSVFPVAYSSSPILSRREVTGSVVVFHDVTERKRVEEERMRLYKEVEEALRIRDDFLTAASHDLRTPLTSVKGRIELMQMRLDKGKELSDDFLRAQVSALHKGAAHMLAVVDEVTDVARLQMGRQLSLDRRTLDVGELAHAAATLVGGARGQERVPIVVEARDGLLIEGDRMRLERVLHNVIGNAVKYSPAATPVHVEVREQPDAVAVVVRDSGVGIPAGELPHVFTRFYRASTSRGVAGTGVGLAGSKSIVEQHGGRITLESAVGEGTTVTITLPKAVSDQLSAVS